MSTRELVCINCPMGCRLTAELDGSRVLSVTGNACPRGKKYAEDECVDPKRMVTALAGVEGRLQPLPVKTSRPVKKDLMFRCAEAAGKALAKPPVHIGDVIVVNAADSGADLVATAEVE